MGSSPPVAKITCPSSTGYLPRPRLFRQLDELPETPVLWITGPPGCGKTALVSSYLQSRGLPCLWYKVDEADADLSTFFYYLGLAAKRAAPRRRRPLPLLTPERLPGVAVFAQRYFEALSSLVPIPSLLVLDDCHRLPQGSAFFEALREGVVSLAPGIGTVLISRSDPHPCFARHRANRLLATLGWEDLRLTIEEAAGIARLQEQGEASAELLQDLFARTDGWAAGLVLLLARAERENVAPQIIGRDVPAEIIDYFGSEVFRRLKGERRDFLLRTAFLPRMTASMAEQLTGVEGAGRILSEMTRRNQFTKKYAHQEPVYEYHDLFRDFLLKQAAEGCPAKQLDEVRRTAAALLERAGYIEDAAVLCREGRDWQALSGLILSRAGSLVAQGRNQTALEWLGALPREVLESDPWLLYWRGVCLLPLSPADSRALFEEALQKFDARREAAGVFRSWAGVVESIIVPTENYAPLDRWIALLPTLIETYGGLPAGEIGDEVTCWMFRALGQRQYPRSAVDAWTLRAVALHQTTQDRHLKFPLTLAILAAFQITKDTREAERSFATLRERLRHSDTTPLVRLMVDALEVVCLALAGESERCLRTAIDGLAFADDTGVHIVDTFLQTYGAAAARKLGDFETANRLLRKMSAALDTMKPLPLGHFHYLSADEALQQGDLGRAASHAEQSLRLWEEGGFTTHVPGALILKAHVHFVLHEDDEAFRLAREAGRIGHEIDQSLAVWLSNLTEAYFHLRRGTDAAALAPLRTGLQVGREAGLFGLSVRLTDMFETVAVAALKREIEIAYVQELIRRNRLTPDPANPDLEQWPWPVKIYTLGRFGLLVDGHAVDFGRKAQQRPLALLKALVALGGREVPMGRLADLLWPEADGDLAHHALEVALGRLRRVLGNADTLVVQEGRLSLSRQHSWVDTWAFERAAGRAEEANKRGDQAEAIRLHEDATKLYRGSFLHLDEAPWTISPRERLRARFMKSIAHLGGDYEKVGQWEDAASCYRRGLEADELVEDLYRRLMVCHIKRGKAAEALRVYGRCQRTLSSVLGVDPSGETRAIVTSLGHPHD